MILSEIGKHTWIFWMKIPEHFPFVKLGAFVVMPNHIHGIIVIDKPKTGITSGGYGVGGDGVDRQRNTKNQFGPQSQNLASVIRGFKIGVTLYCKKNKMLFGWQPRYHDHIIRNKGEFEHIQNYILNNPINWQEDVHYSS